MVIISVTAAKNLVILSLTTLPGNSKQGQAHLVSDKDSPSIKEEFLFMSKEIVLKNTYSIVTERRGNENIWLIDSGATSHVGINKESFATLDIGVQGYMELADSKKKSLVHGRGSMIIRTNVDGKEGSLKIDDVLYCPSFSVNLLSVKKLLSNAVQVKFGVSEFEILQGGKLLAKATVGPDTYELYGFRSVCPVAGKVHAAVADDDQAAKGIHGVDCIHAWHRKLGHRYPNAIKTMCRKALATGIVIKDCGVVEMCETCVK